MSEEADGNASTVNARALLSPRTRKEYKCQFHPGRFRLAGMPMRTVLFSLCTRSLLTLPHADATAGQA
jgi:hypothetical protein